MHQDNTFDYNIMNLNEKANESTYPISEKKKKKASLATDESSSIKIEFRLGSLQHPVRPPLP